jgi:MFS family permease
MPPTVHHRAVDDLGRARLATWLLFAATGGVAATWAARLPAVQDRFGLTPAGLAVVVLGVEGGALAGLPVGAALAGRWGSRAAARLGLAVFAPGLLLAALAPTPVWLVAAVTTWAAANSVLDVALNTQGVDLDRRYGRPVLAGLHAGQGVGLLGGAALGTVAAAAAVPLPLHAAVVGGGALVVGLAGTTALVREPTARPGPRTRARRSGRLLLLGAVAFCAFLLDGSATTWIAVHLRTEHTAGEGLAAAGYLTSTAALVAGRLAGDPLVARWSRRRVVQGCAVGTAGGVAAAALAPGIIGAMAGWALVGLSLAPLAPAVLGAAPAAAGVPAPQAIAAVTTVGYLGSFTGPPAVGLVAEAWGLPSALLLLVGASLVAAALATAALRGPRPAAGGLSSRPGGTGRGRPPTAGAAHRPGRCWRRRRTPGGGPAADRGR